MDTTEGLRKLMRACVDDERTLLHERRFVDPVRAEKLTRLTREREQFVADLERLGGRIGRRQSGSWGELLREAARNVWVTAAGRNNADALTTCRHSRARTEELYDAALHDEWPEAIRRVLAAQKRRLHDETDELNQLRF